MAEVEIGIGRSARRAYAFDEVAIVPSRRTRDPEDVDISWEVDAFRFELPVMAGATDSVTSPATAAQIGRMGGVGALNLEGLWTRYADPEPCFEEIASLPQEKVTRRMQEIYSEPIKRELVVQRIREIRDAGVVSCAAVTPQRAAELAPVLAEAELDLLLIRGDVVSAEHVTRGEEPLNLKRFVRELDVAVIVGGCASYQAALHLMRTGAAGILVGVGGGRVSANRDVLGVSVPQATAVVDARAARMRHLDETGVYVHLIAAGGMRTGGDIAKAIVCGADAVMLGSPLAAALEAPGRGWHWDSEAFHPDLPRSSRIRTEPRGTLHELLLGPSHEPDGATNLIGALRASMATCGYDSVKDFQKAEVVLTPRV